MRVKFTGDFAELARFEDRIRKVPEVMLTVSEQLAEESIELVREGFDEKKDPYGNAWADHAPLTQQVRPGGNILDDSGGLRTSWSRREAGLRGFRIASHKETAAYHQDGTGIHGPKHKAITPVRAKALRVMTGAGPVFMQKSDGAPPRRMVPDKGLPERWRRRYVETATEVLNELFS